MLPGKQRENSSSVFIVEGRSGTVVTHNFIDADIFETLGFPRRPLR